MPCPIITVEQMRQWEEATWATGKTSEEVIHRVGQIIAARVLQLTKPGDLVVTLAGKGHNGDDARSASLNLPDRKLCQINVTNPRESLAEFKAQIALRPALIVDGLFGIGLNRQLDEAWVEFIRAINESAVPVLAVDVPSGLNAETGEPSPSAVRASITLTLGAPKREMLRANAWPYVGRLEVAPDIGLVAQAQSSDLQWTLPEDFRGFPRPAALRHTREPMGISASSPGSSGWHGAAVLATDGALRAQPGLVTLMTTEEVYAPVAAQLQAAMVQFWQRGLMDRIHFTSLLIGPGLANPNLPEAMATEVRRAWAHSAQPVIVDASGLTWLAAGATRSQTIRVITPHPGEAARLLATTTAEVQSDRPGALRKLSQRYGGCWVVLKGHQTLIGRADGEIYVNPSGNPNMAQGGSGDLLAGYLAGLLAQPLLQNDPLQTIRYAVWQHGASADLLTAQRRNWTIEDLAHHLGSALP